MSVEVGEEFVMELKKHGRYDYSPIIERPDYDWPEGKRLAVYIGLNIEHFSFGEGLGHTPTNPGVQPDVRNYAWRDYGLRVGIWRVFNLLDELGKIGIINSECGVDHLREGMIEDIATKESYIFI